MTTDLPNVPGAPTTLEDAVAQYFAAACELNALPYHARYHGTASSILTSRKEMLQEYIEYFASQRTTSDTGNHRIECGHGIVFHVYEGIDVKSDDVSNVDVIQWAEQHAPHAIRTYLNGDDVRMAISKMPPSERPSWSITKRETYLDIPQTIGKEQP